jgi:hypothetical protein
MRYPSFNREAIEAEIDRIRSLGVDALRSQWRAANQIAATISAAMGRADRGSHAAQEKNEL